VDAVKPSIDPWPIRLIGHARAIAERCETVLGPADAVDDVGQVHVSASNRTQPAQT